MAKPVLLEGSAENVLSEVSTEDLYRELLVRFGEDPSRDGLLRTPERVRKAILLAAGRSARQLMLPHWEAVPESWTGAS